MSSLLTPPQASSDLPPSYSSTPTINLASSSSHAPHPSSSLRRGIDEQLALPPTPPLAPTDLMVPAFPLEDVLHVPPTERTNNRHLPHLISAALSLSLTKPSVHLVLSEPISWISPPQRDAYGLRPEDYGIDVEGTMAGKDATISGFINVVSPTRKHVKAIAITLLGRHRLAFESGVMWEDDTFMRKELIVGGEEKGGIWLEKGVNTWEFSFTIPSDSPVYDFSPSGWTKYQITGTVVGSGSLLSKDLSDTKPCIVTCKPHREITVLQFSAHEESLSSHFGPYALELTSNEFLIAGPFNASITLACPPPSLTIYAINAYLVQTTHIVSSRPGGRTSEVRGTKQYLVREGERGGYASTEFTKEARKRGKLVFEGAKVGKEGGLKEGEMWTWNKFGRLPDEKHIRSTTMPGTNTPFRFSSELVVELVFTESLPSGVEGKVKIATLFKRPVFLGSCGCLLPSLNLPNYGEEDVAATTIPKLKPDGSAFCMCDIPFATLEAESIALMRNGAPAHQPGRGIEYLIERRRGGLIEDFGGGGGVGAEGSEGRNKEEREAQEHQEELGPGTVRERDGRVRKVGEF